jgi:hypothetical protein
MLGERLPGHSLHQEAFWQVFRANKVRRVVWRVAHYVSAPHIPVSSQTPDLTDHIPLAPPWYIHEAMLRENASIQGGKLKSETRKVLQYSIPRRRNDADKTP